MAGEVPDHGEACDQDCEEDDQRGELDEQNASIETAKKDLWIGSGGWSHKFIGQKLAEHERSHKPGQSPHAEGPVTGGGVLPCEQCQVEDQ